MEPTSLDPSLKALLRDLPGEERATRLLRTSRIRAVEQLAALQITDVSQFADLVLSLAARCDPEIVHWPELRGARGDLVHFWEICGPSIPESAATSRQVRSHGILHEGGEATQTLRELVEDPARVAPSPLQSDRKRRRIYPSTVDEILPPPAMKPTPRLQEWEEIQHNFWIYRLSRIATRAQGAAGIWQAIQAFPEIDRDQLWKDTLGASEWRTTRAICYAFEALERWALKKDLDVYPARIETLVRYILDRDREPKGCPRSLPGSLRSAVKTVYCRLRIEPVPDFENALWSGQVKKIKDRAPKKDPGENAVPIPPGFIWYFEDLVHEGSLLEKIMAGLFLFMIWCSLRFNDAIRTNVFKWVIEDHVIIGVSKAKRKKIKRWIIANYSLGDRAWLIHWFRLLWTLEPTDRDFLVANLKTRPGSSAKDRALVWTQDPLQYDVANDLFHEMITSIALRAGDRPEILTQEEADAYVPIATLQGLRSTVPSMGSERKHRDRAVRFQGDWAGNHAMPDHYTKSKLAITLGMVSSLVRDLKSGWRPGPKAAPDLLIMDLPDLPAEKGIQDSNPVADAADDDRDSDASDMGEISGPTIDFYAQKIKPTMKKVDPNPPRLHVRDLAEPTWPACTRLKNQGVMIADMIHQGTFPTSVTMICHWCRQKRPEIMDQLEGYTVETV